jgi:uncharacterized NAD(P)/FAD-binding protein YdhS
MALSVAARIAAARARGVLRVVGGRLERIEAASDGLRAFWRARGADAVQQLQVQRIINCSGPETDYERIEDPLVGQLIAAGLVRPDPYRLGLHATTRGALIGRDGWPSRRLFGVGPIARGGLWEIVSVPEIRTQAEDVAMAALAAARGRAGVAVA